MNLILDSNTGANNETSVIFTKHKTDNVISFFKDLQQFLQRLISGRSAGFEIRVPSIPFTSCVTLRKLLNLSEVQLPYL